MDWCIKSTVSLSGAIRQAANGLLPKVTARRWISRHASIPALICAEVGLVLGGNRSGTMACAALPVIISLVLLLAAMVDG